MLERWRVYCLIFLVAVLCNGLVVMRANGQESSVAQLQEQASDILRIISSSDPDSSLTAENHLTAFAKKYGTAAQKVLEQEIRSDISRPEEREALSVALFRVRNDKDPRQLLVEELRKITGIAGDAKTFGRISGIEDKAVLDLFPNTCIFLLRERSSAVSYRNLSQQNLLVVWSTGEVQVVSNPTDLKLLLMHSPSMIIDEQVAREVIEAWFRLATALSQREGFRFTIAEEAFQRNAGTWSIHAKATVDPTDGNTGFLEMSVKTGPSGRIEEATTQTSLSSGWVDIVTSPQNVFGFEVPMLVLLILAFIVGFFMFHLIGYWTAIAKVSGQLNEGKNIASAYSMPIIGPDKAKLDEEFKSLPALSVAWGEFSETLLPHQDAEQTVYFNTKPAGEFINVESVLDKNINTGFYNAIPGILTGMGLFGTFSAIFFGLHGLNVNPADGQVTGIQLFINQLSGKFLSSLIGLGCAILFLTVERSKTGEVATACLELHHRLDELFPPKIQEALLGDMLKQLTEQSDSLRSFDSKLAGTLKKGLEESMTPIMNRMLDAIDQLLVATQNLQREKEESSSEVIERIVENFKSSLTEGANVEIQKLSHSLAETSAYMQSTNTNVAQLLAHADETFRSQQEQTAKRTGEMERTFDELMMRVDLMLQSQATNMHKQMDSINSGMSQFIEQSESWSIRVSEQLEQNLTKQRDFNVQFQEQVASTVQTVINDLEQQSASSARRTQEVVDQLLARVDAWHTEVSGRFEELSSRIIKQVAAASASQLEALKNTSEEILTGVKQWIHQLDQDVQSIADTLRSEREALERTAKALTEGLASLDGTVQGQAEFLKRMTAAADTVRTSSSTLLDAAEKLAQQDETQRKGTQVLIDQLGHGEQVIEQFRQLLREEAAVHNGLSTSIGETLSQINTRVREHSTHTGQLLGDYLSTFDKHLAQAAARLDGTVRELENQLEELTDSINQAVSAINGRG